MTAMIYDLIGSAKSTFNGHGAPLTVAAESQDAAFRTYRRVFPTGGDPACTDSRPALLAGEVMK